MEMNDDGRKPDFGIIGAARSGTTALTRLLDQHTDIFMTDPKEPHFYAHAGRDVDYGGHGDDLMMNSRVVSSESDFYGLFDDATDGQLKGDGSVSTLCFPDVAIPNIKKYGSKNFKLIVMLRSPVSRCHSSYLYLRARGHEPVESFSRALELEQERVKGNFHHMWRYQELSHYKKQLEPFHREFGDDMLILILEEFKLDWRGEIRKVVEFLGLNDDHEFQEQNDVNRGGEPKRKWIVNASNIIRKNPRIEQIAKAVIPAHMREKLRSQNLVVPTMADDIEARLIAQFADDVSYVESLIGRRISEWH